MWLWIEDGWASFRAFLPRSTKKESCHSCYRYFLRAGFFSNLWRVTEISSFLFNIPASLRSKCAPTTLSRRKEMYARAKKKDWRSVLSLYKKYLVIPNTNTVAYALTLFSLVGTWTWNFWNLNLRYVFLEAVEMLKNKFTITQNRFVLKYNAGILCGSCLHRSIACHCFISTSVTNVRVTPFHYKNFSTCASKLDTLIFTGICTPN